MKHIEINDEFEEAKKAIESGQNVTLLGKAGTGKSTFLRWVLSNIGHLQLDEVILAPTGLAAVNVGGQTIHSFFQLPPKLDEYVIQSMTNKVRSKIKHLDLLIIDEISMVRADLLDMIDDIMQFATDCYEPFGGKQVLFIGDLYQLPPVLKRNDREEFFKDYETEYFFSSRVMKSVKYKTVELTKVYRQNDTEFIDVLSNIRKGTITDSDKSYLNQRVGVQIDHSIYLTSVNAQADQINVAELSKLTTELHTFDGRADGTFLNKEKPAPEMLCLRIGAQIMTVTNDENWVNGTIAEVTEITRNKIVAVTDKDELLVITRHTWEMGKYELSNYDKSGKWLPNPKLVRNVTGTYTQFPVKLAWAVTIHKSQGQTFDKAVIDLSRIFTAGQAYVALSRIRSYEGLSLVTPLQPNHVKSDHRVDKYLALEEEKKNGK